MNSNDRQRELDKIYQRTKTILESKGNDYATSEDTLSNFKTAAAVCGITDLQQCLSLIATKVARLGVLLSGTDPKNEPIDDSVIDLINYGFLLHCLLVDKGVSRVEQK